MSRTAPEFLSTKVGEASFGVAVHAIPFDAHAPRLAVEHTPRLPAGDIAAGTGDRGSIQRPRPALIRRLNKATKYAVDNRISLKIPRLDMDSLRIVGSSDASLANNYDLSTQLGHICFLADNDGNVVPIDFKSYKSKTCGSICDGRRSNRVQRSVRSRLYTGGRDRRDPRKAYPSAAVYGLQKPL